ncbi:MAG TPA: SRPBCC family protein [Dyadobacter sp.]|jgi:uncharacterized protein YndB with AHSA1/START domain|nr:SRPBCC family protein [Dyadobacter sp.]
MKIIKIILIAIVSIVALVLIVALFVSKEFHVEKEIVINKPVSAVFNYAKILKNQEQYNVWVMADPNMKTNLKGRDGNVGFVYAWDGNDEAGQGEQEITKIIDNERLETAIRFIRPFEGKAETYLVTESNGATQTKVVWGMKGKSVYPMNITNLFTDTMLGNDVNKSLTNLKIVLEK